MEPGGAGWGTQARRAQCFPRHSAPADARPNPTQPPWAELLCVCADPPWPRSSHHSPSGAVHLGLALPSDCTGALLHGPGPGTERSARDFSVKDTNKQWHAEKANIAHLQLNPIKLWYFPFCTRDAVGDRQKSDMPSRHSLFYLPDHRRPTSPPAGPSVPGAVEQNPPNHS